MKKFINPILRLGTAIALLSVIYMQNSEIKELKEKSQIIEKVAPLPEDINVTNLINSIESERDSLREELFMERVDAGRHEVAREEILGKYPKIAKEYDEFYSHQTE